MEENDSVFEKVREIVVPGEFLGKDMNNGPWTYRIGNEIYSMRLGIKSVRGKGVGVVPLAGKYIPKVGDLVIGIVSDITPNLWYIDINSFNPATLHVADVPWRVDFGFTGKYMNIGDSCLAKVKAVDETKIALLTMNDKGLKKLSRGEVVEISATKVPRLIGRGGSMINMIKEYTKCRILVGQNGRVWIEGDLENMAMAIQAIKLVEEKSHLIGLTEIVKDMLENAKRGE
ncbi:MAG: RNA-binding protein [Thermoplasmata archaeon]|nr:MAG: RNA-binding protein [Thermoplasmata archaeon]